jgi:hypothetical protein
MKGSDTSSENQPASSRDKAPGKVAPRGAVSVGGGEQKGPDGAVAALLRLAALDADLLDLEAKVRKSATHTELEDRALAADLERRRAEVAEEQAGLRARVSAEVLETYATALRSGRGPAIVKLVQSVCSGCYMRLHSKLEDQIRRRWGIAACPHCRRLVYDPTWLEGSGSGPDRSA